MDAALLATDDAHVAVAVMDIDRFKAVNDDRGHQAGDELLQQLAVRLSNVLSGADCLYRIGGDEFAAILHVNEVSEANAAAERLLQAALSQGGRSVSVGLAVAVAGETATAVVRRADQALYRAKRAGRNTYRLETAPGRTGDR